jgi:DNA-binding transcriptional LysR family regulator
LNLHNLDLNLLVALDALLRERHVTRAGQHIGLSQPAMSRNLAKLRDLFDDPLLFKGGDGLQLTSRASELAPKVSLLLHQVNDLLQPSVFVPHSAHKVFSVIATDYVSFVLLRPLLSILKKQAPHMVLSIESPTDGFPKQALSLGKCDLVIGTFFELPDDVISETLFVDHFASAVRCGHPALDTKQAVPDWSPERFVQWEHALVLSPGKGPGVVDFALEKLGLKRNISVYLDQFLMAPFLVARSDLILTMPAQAIHELAAVAGLQVFVPPLELPPFAVSMVWDQRTKHDPSHVWFREQIRTLTASWT